LHRSIFNRKLRKSIFPFGLYDELDSNGYINLSIQSIAKNNNEPLLHFTTRKEGVDYLTAIVEKFQLCQKLCDLYATKSACFHYNIKECNGACVGEESPEVYNERVNQLVNHLSFEGKTFYIIDKGRNKGEKSIVWIDGGTYKGYGLAPFHFHGKEPQDWTKYIKLQSENRYINTIVNLFLRKGNSYRIVTL